MARKDHHTAMLTSLALEKTNITLSIALAAVFSSSVAFAEVEVTGKIVHESAAFTNSGIGIGAATTSSQTANSHGQDVFKTETSARIYIDGTADDLTEGATYHVEVNAFTNGKGVNDYSGNEYYTQRDVLREVYVDAEINGVDIRFGKQQVVWGTADGMKLLDAINPTDYSEMAQNQMEDSRIPVWMLNAEADTSKGNWQFIVSEGKSSHMAGMGDSSENMGTTHYSISDSGSAFIMKGVDTISGKVNGMINVVPAMGAVATAFQANGNTSAMTMAHVEDFATNTSAGETAQHGAFGAICTSGATSVGCLESMVNDATNQVGGTAAGNANAQNLFSDTTAAQWTAGKANPTQVFHYMPEATFATFDQFVGLQSRYTVEDKDDLTVAARYKNSTADGLNYSFNVMNGNDTNPYIDTYWTDDSNNVLAETRNASYGGVYVTNNLGNGTTVGGSAAGGTHAVWNMVEKLNNITQVGGSFDTAIETATLGPIVLRGEALYQVGVMSPIVTRKSNDGVDLNHGFLASALKMTKGDRFKYVLGADITALTNMMVSVQFIQDVNLNFVDIGNADANDWKYTADMATMHLSNNLNKGKEAKEFYSVFLSKPFGASGEHRWNNIFMYEDGAGKWNRLDAEFSIDDNTQATLEWNKYFGDENTQFGQFAKSSNIQVGVKYSF